MPKAADGTRVMELFPRGATLNVDAELPSKIKSDEVSNSSSEKSEETASHSETSVRRNKATEKAKQRSGVVGALNKTKAAVEENEASGDSQQDNFVLADATSAAAYFNSFKPNNQ